MFEIRIDSHAPAIVQSGECSRSLDVTAIRCLKINNNGPLDLNVQNVIKFQQFFNCIAILNELMSYENVF